MAKKIKSAASLFIGPAERNTDTVRDFAATVLAATGAVIDPIPDGALHRFDCPDGKRGNRAAWYVLYNDQRSAGRFGCWRCGASHTWSAQPGRHSTPAERAQAAGEIAAARVRRDRQHIEEQRQAARRASALLNASAPATTGHPYVARKGIPALCLRESGGCLFVPLRSVDGVVVNLQRIFPDGRKRFLRGGQISGAFALFGRALPEDGELYIAEGWATAATIASVSRLPVVAAMSAGNLEPVAKAIHKARPHLKLVLAADNDHKTPGNPGKEKAIAAARAVGAGVTWPTTCLAQDCQCTDFNDTSNCPRAPR